MNEERPPILEGALHSSEPMLQPPPAGTYTRKCGLYRNWTEYGYVIELLAHNP